MWTQCSRNKNATQWIPSGWSYHQMPLFHIPFAMTIIIAQLLLCNSHPLKLWYRLSEWRTSIFAKTKSKICMQTKPHHQIAIVAASLIFSFGSLLVMFICQAIHTKHMQSLSVVFCEPPRKDDFGQPGFIHIRLFISFMF